MDQEKRNNYREDIIQSLNHTSYTTKKEKERILKKLLGSNLISKEESRNDKNLTSILRNDDKNLHEIIKVIENHEYNSRYTYALIYSLKEHGEFNSFKDLCLKIKELSSNSDVFNTLNFDKLRSRIGKPSFFEDDECFYIKFSLLKSKNKERAETIKYPIICQFYKQDEIMVLFFNMLPSEYGGDENYIEDATSIENWLERNLNIELLDFDSFTASKNLWEQREKNEVLYKNITEFTEYSYDPFHGKVRLRANTKNKLAIMSELNTVIKTFESENDRNKMLSFLEGYRNSFTFFQRGLTWHWEYNKTRTSKINVEFKKNYLESSKGLIHFHSHNQSKERIDYVINDITRHRTLPPRAIITK